MRRNPLEKLILLLGLFLTLTWPVLLGGAIAGRDGVIFGILLYAVFGALFLVLVLLGGVRGILGS